MQKSGDMSKGTPSEELVDFLVPLLADGLLLPEDIERHKRKISSGQMKEEDWLFVAENALEMRDPK